jgi:signal transduction histidine kinase
VEVRATVCSEAAGVPELVVEVCDNGLGVPLEGQNHLFERFFRAHGNTVTGVEGTGLGLSIVRETMESIGGRAWAQFHDEGSSFLLAVPCRRAAVDAATDARGDGEPTPPQT